MGLVVRIIDSAANTGTKYVGLCTAVYSAAKGTAARQVVSGGVTYVEGGGTVTSVRVGLITNNGDFVLYDI